MCFDDVQQDGFVHWAKLILISRGDFCKNERDFGVSWDSLGGNTGIIFSMGPTSCAMV